MNLNVSFDFNIQMGKYDKIDLPNWYINVVFVSLKSNDLKNIFRSWENLVNEKFFHHQRKCRDITIFVD